MAEPTTDGPYTAAVKAGRCPLCRGTGATQPGTICVHDGPLHAPGEPCDLCQGTGAWPPPEPPPLAAVHQNGWSR